jgi:hypothetical protein
MKYDKISCYAVINEVDREKVESLKKSIKKNGWNGLPILYTELELITGSHRLIALQELDKEYDNGDIEKEYEDNVYNVLCKNENICEDVTDIINEYCSRGEDVEYDSLGKMFNDTWVEKYKNEIIEW